MLFLAKTNIHKYPIATMFFGYSYLYKYIYLQNRKWKSDTPQKAKKAIKRIFIEFTSYMYIVCMYVAAVEYY